MLLILCNGAVVGVAAVSVIAVNADIVLWAVPQSSKPRSTVGQIQIFCSANRAVAVAVVVAVAVAAAAVALVALVALVAAAVVVKTIGSNH